MMRHSSKLVSMLARSFTLSSQQSKQFEITNNIEFASKVMNSSIPVIVNFHADWCEPCKILTPKLIDLIEPLEKINLAIIDVDLNPELADTIQVKAVPAILVISNGLVIDKFVGLDDLRKIEDIIHKLTHQNVPSPSASEDRTKT